MLNQSLRRLGSQIAGKSQNIEQENQTISVSNSCKKFETGNLIYSDNSELNDHGINYENAQRFQQKRDYCSLSAIIVAKHFGVSIAQMMCKTRAKAKVARARQIAIYLAHTKFSVSYRQAAIFFHRDRTTIAHACKIIEDQRDDQNFDAMITKVEYLVEDVAKLSNKEKCGYVEKIGDSNFCQGLGI